ncbi:hypothetical protein FRC12_021972 [Ceratobasidium sp. 428]|nr:hypothetical protein FRC12_021972 [Ceratobasidium sp. 428]
MDPQKLTALQRYMNHSDNTQPRRSIRIGPSLYPSGSLADDVYNLPLGVYAFFGPDQLSSLFPNLTTRPAALALCMGDVERMASVSPNPF